MRIAIEASTWVNPRGYGRFTRELTRALVRSNSAQEFTLILDSGAAQATDLPDVARIVVPTKRPVVQAAVAERARSVLDIWRMSRALSSSAYDVVLFPTLYSFVPVWSAARVLVIVHDALPERMPRLVLGSRRAQLFWRIKSRLACRRADVIATVSAAAVREIGRALPVGDAPIVVLTEGCAEIFSPNPTPLDAERVRAYVPDSCPFILYVGGMSPHKRVPELIRAFGRLAASPSGAGLRLVLAGPAGHDRFVADRAGIDDALGEVGAAAARIKQTGFVPDETLAALYRAARCVVLPSAAEGFGLTALEAMASSTPVVVSRVPALEELCGEAAEYFDDPAGLPLTLTRLLEDPERRARLGEAGVQRARSFEWSQSAARLLAALE